MKYIANIDVMPQKEILDPQGKAVKLGLKNLGVLQVEDVRIGKHITMEFEAETETEAKEKVELACSKLLANMIMEDFTYQLSVVKIKN
jgi:phosphoribosylformylglycinamidine synthase subunit PurS